MKFISDFNGNRDIPDGAEDRKQFQDELSAEMAAGDGVKLRG